MEPRTVFAIFAAVSLAFLAGCLGSQDGMLGQQQENPEETNPATPAAPPSEIGWIKSYEEGLKKAQKENKPLLVYFWAVWCAFCAKMDKEVLSDREVISFLKNSFVPVLLDVDDEGSFKYMGDYRVVGTPTFVIISPQGELLRGVVGYKTKEEFMDFLRG